ncbi:NADH dehydrogenase 1 alpha subcomplex subunit 1 [Hibiscus syriacus]|uniref:NADH dehydrogenase 1 alpha subcomplex subunit 1 n=1 Tax=Hibiscus syriacus TaxID=106335 RepID=A0A6A3AQG4_HIBSY|nr:NADH dehydrogenase 1 alpha subcomplex subunit 1 [Hibiscus syriacus]
MFNHLETVLEEALSILNTTDKKMASTCGPNEYGRVFSCSNAKEICDKLQVTHEGTDEVRETKISLLNHSYENFKMKPDEDIKAMNDRFSMIVNGLKGFGEVISNENLSDEDDSNDEDEVANLCLMAIEGESMLEIPIRLWPYLVEARFCYVARYEGHCNVESNMISALVEWWRPEAHTFHLLCGECMITLEDVSIHLGLPVDEGVLSGVAHGNWNSLCHEYLGGEQVKMYARSSILQLIGGLLMPDKSHNQVHCKCVVLLTIGKMLSTDISFYYSLGRGIACPLCPIVKNSLVFTLLLRWYTARKDHCDLPDELESTRLLIDQKAGTESMLVHPDKNMGSPLATSDAVYKPMDMVKQGLQLGKSGAYELLMNAPYTTVHFATYEAVKRGLIEISPECNSVFGVFSLLSCVFLHQAEAIIKKPVIDIEMVKDMDTSEHGKGSESGDSTVVDAKLNANQSDAIHQEPDMNESSNCGHEDYGNISSSQSMFDQYDNEKRKEMARLLLPVGVNDTVIPGVEWDEDFFVLMIDSYGKADIVQEAVKIFQKMEELGMDRTINMMLSLRLDTANRFYEDMKTRGIAPDTVTYNTLINGYTQFKRMEEDEKLFVETKAKNLAPTIISYTTTINGYVVVEQVDDGLRFFEEMKSIGIKPNASSDVLKAMIRLSIPIEAGHYGVLIENFCKANEFDQAIKLLDKLVEKEIVLRPENSLEIEDIRTLIRAVSNG